MMKEWTRKNTEERGFEIRLLKLLWGTAVFLLVLGMVGALLVQSRIFDPKPVGELQIDIQPVGELVVADNRQLIWQDVSLPEGDFSVRETAVFHSGNPDSLYGLAIGNEQHHLIIAVSPLGYVLVEQSTINNQQLTNPQSPIPLQTWPHVRTGTTPNEIWVDVVGDEVTVRLNRELLWMGEVDGLAGQVGIVAESFGETAVFEFQQLQLFWENHE